MKAFKAEILKEMRSEITKAKNEIIDGKLLMTKLEMDILNVLFNYFLAIKVEFNRRR